MIDNRYGSGTINVQGSVKISAEFWVGMLHREWGGGEVWPDVGENGAYLPTIKRDSEGIGG